MVFWASFCSGIGATFKLQFTRRIWGYGMVQPDRPCAVQRQDALQLLVLSDIGRTRLLWAVQEVPGGSVFHADCFCANNARSCPVFQGGCCCNWLMPQTACGVCFLLWWRSAGNHGRPPVPLRFAGPLRLPGALNCAARRSAGHNGLLLKGAFSHQWCLGCGVSVAQPATSARFVCLLGAPLPLWSRLATTCNLRRQ
jgi:hypothetical protein